MAPQVALCFLHHPTDNEEAMFTPLECRLRADKCEKMAQRAPNAHVRDTLVEIQRMTQSAQK